MEQAFVQEFLRDIVRDQLQEVLTLLRQKGLIWRENCFLAETGAVEAYFHIHPLFTFRLQSYLATWAAMTREADTYYSFFRSPYWGFATYYDKRVFEFDDSDSLNANISREKMVLELDNVISALEIWLSTEESSYLPSWILSRMGQSFNLAILGKDQFRKVLDTLDHIVEHFRDAVTKTPGSPKLEISQTVKVISFLRAAEILQNMYFATEEWSLVRHYTNIIEEVLDANEPVLESSEWVKAQRAQTRMVKGYESFARAAYKEAKDMFEANLAGVDPQEISTTTRVGYLKIRFMNALGLWKCQLEDPDYHLKSMSKRLESIKEKVMEWSLAASSITTGHGHNDHKYILDLMARWEPMIDQIFRASEDGGEGEGIVSLHFYVAFARLIYVQKIDDLNSFVEETGKNFPMRQNAMKTMYSTFAKANVLRAPQNLSSALLTGLTNAYHDQIDDVGISSYLQQLTAALVKSDDYETALETHDRWTLMRRTKREAADKHIELADEYTLALCYYGIGDFEKAQSHCDNALQLSSNTKADKVRLASLHIAAMLELRSGNFTRAVQHLSEAGVLAYAEESNAQYQKKGSIVQMIYAVGCFAMAFVEDESILSKEKQPILVSSTGNKQFPREGPGVSQARERKRPSEILKELFSAASEKIGVMKTLNFIAELSSSPGTFINEENNISWERVECHLFGTRTSEEPDPWNTVANSVIRMASSLRDESQRSILWHICGGANCDLSSFSRFGLPTDSLPVEIFTPEVAKHLVKLVLDFGANHSLFDNEGRTPLMRAVETNNFEIADLLLQHGADPDYQSFVDETALHEAIKRQNLAQVQYCLSNAFPLNTRNLNGMTALGVAVSLDSTEICRTLLRSGANPLARDYIGRSCLRLSLEFSKYDNFCACLGTLTTMPRDELADILLDYGYTHTNVNEILVAAEDFPQYIVELLKEITIPPDCLTRPDKAGVTFFHRAAWLYPQEAVYHIFLQWGADPSIQEDCFGLTVLHLTAANSNASQMYQLIKSERDGASDSKDRIMNLNALDMVAWNGITGKLTGENFEIDISLPARKHLLTKYFVAWAKKCRDRYVVPLTAAEIKSLVEFKRVAAFSEPQGLENDPRASAFQRATVDYAYASMAARNPGPGRSFTSQAAARLSGVENMLRGIAEADASEELPQERWDILWALNPLRMPHVFYFDRHGVCHYTEPLYQREDPTYRVWVVDEHGLVKGVLGALDV